MEDAHEGSGRIDTLNPAGTGVGIGEKCPEGHGSMLVLCLRFPLKCADVARKMGKCMYE